MKDGRLQSDYFNVIGGVVSVGAADELDELQRKYLGQALQSLGAQRKGPFSLFGERIDAAWRSDIKWRRVAELIGSFHDLVVCDVGANNGYYLYCLAQAGVASALGLEIAAQPLQFWNFVSSIHQPSCISMEEQGYERLASLDSTFDLILLMGILYHHSDPVRILRLCRDALRPGGRLLVETMSLPGGLATGPLLLCPRARFAGMRGVWQVPAVQAVLNWLERCGFRKVSWHGEYEYMEEHPGIAALPGLRQGLNDDCTLTIEGYPAPRRSYYTAYR
ncbi:MAG: DUF1698 domain-containing protein [Leptospirales bacterium]|nr:DUF1698 domain-containing protein [Leptospirales bacterium]